MFTTAVEGQLPPAPDLSDRVLFEEFGTAKDVVCTSNQSSYTGCVQKPALALQAPVFWSRCGNALPDEELRIY